MKSKGRFGMTLLIVTAVVLAAAGLAAAQQTGEIQGHVQDAEGKALSGVAVRLLQAGKPDAREQASDAEGDFRFEDLAGGVYIATVSMEGFSPVTCPGLRIVGVARQLRITLVPAGGEQSSTCSQGEG